MDQSYQSVPASDEKQNSEATHEADSGSESVHQVEAVAEVAVNTRVRRGEKKQVDLLKVLLMTCMSLMTLLAILFAIAREFVASTGVIVTCVAPLIGLIISHSPKK